MLPNWIIAGVPKAATSALFRWLVDHPEVAGSRDKETYYFVDPGTHMFDPDDNFLTGGLAGYRRKFPKPAKNVKVVIEATPGYMYSDTAVERLPQLPTKPSFIFVLREPVGQLRSLFHYFQQNWNWIPRKMTFAAYLSAVVDKTETFGGNELAQNALNNAWYSAHLRRWSAGAGKDRMLVLLFDDLVADRRAFMRSLSDRLGIDRSFYDDYAFPRENESYVARSAILQDLNIKLRQHVPKGAAYRLLRGAYRRLNTRRGHGPSASGDSGLERALADHFRPMLAELDRDFALDVSTRWGPPRRPSITPDPEDVGRNPFQPLGLHR